MNLSIIIVNYNTRELLRKCLESILDSKIDIKNTEIIVVDNASTDGSVKMLHESKVLLIENNKNFGFAKAVNQALRGAMGETIILLNSDTQVKPGAISRLLEFEKKVKPAIIGAKLILPDGSVQPSVFHFPTIKRALLEYWFGKKGSYVNYVPEGSQPSLVDAIAGGAMLISREIIEKVGNFDERYFMFYEDLDYCRRVRKAGYSVYYLPSALIRHEHGASGRNLAGKEEQWKRLIPSSKLYNGRLKHYLLFLIIRLGRLK